LLIYTDDTGSKSLQNGSILLPHYMVSHPMRYHPCVTAVTISSLQRLAEYLTGRSYLKIYQYIILKSTYTFQFW